MVEKRKRGPLLQSLESSPWRPIAFRLQKKGKHGLIVIVIRLLAKQSDKSR